MQPKPEGYGDDFTTKCGHCDGTEVNGVHDHSGHLSAMLTQSKQHRIGCHGNETLTCRYFKLGWKYHSFNQSPFRNLLAYIIKYIKLIHKVPFM